MNRSLVPVVVALGLVFAGAAGAIAQNFYTVDRGDGILLRGTKIACSVQPSPKGKSMVCFKVTSRAQPQAGTYGVGISSHGATVVRYGNKTYKTVFQKKHGAS